MTGKAGRTVRAIAAAGAVFFGTLSPSASFAGPDPGEDYRLIFGKEYAEAEKYLEENTWLAESLRLPPDDTAIALAVVFPEIIRFNYFEDLIQVRTLKVLYVQYGRKYANFSVGHFQMKPSFVEQLEADWNGLVSAAEKAVAGIPAFAKGDRSDVRRERILRLDDMRWQVQYLRVFMAVMKKRHRNVVFSDAEDRLRFYATAYNSGYTSGEERIRRAMLEKRFHLELYSPKRPYNYADVALFFFRQPAAR